MNDGSFNGQDAVPGRVAEELRSMDAKLRLVLVEDVEADAELVAWHLSKGGLSCTIRRVQTESDFISALREFQPDVILSDFSLPQFSGLQALALAVALAPETPFLFVSGTIGEERAIDALRRGATDYILKSNLSRLAAAVERARREVSFRAAQRHAEEQLRSSEQQLRATVETSQDWIWETDLQGRFRLCSGAVWAILGYDPSAMLGKDFRSFLHADELDNSTTLLPAAGQSELTGVVARWRTADDQYRWLERNVVSIRNDSGHVIGFRGTDRDITERRRGEQALRQSQATLSMVTRLSRIGAWTLDLSKRVAWWSDGTCDLFGVEPGTSPTMEEVLAFYAPEWRAGIVNARARCADEGIPWDLEAEIITARGRRLWVRSIGEAVRDASGVIRWLQGAMQDLSERKLVEQEMRRLATRLSNMIESLDVSFYTVDQDWRLTYFNREAERLWRRPREKVLGSSLWQEFPELIGSNFERCFRRAVADARPDIMEGLFPDTDTWIRASVYPSDEGLAVYLSDVSVERAGHRQLKLLESSVARLNDMVLITEAAPLEEPGPRICFVTDALLRITGYSREEIMGLSPRVLQGPATDRGELRRIGEALSRFEPVRAELINYRKGGEPYWIELDIVPIAADGPEHSHFVAIQRDITQRKRDEDALRELNLELENRVRTRTAELNVAREVAERANRAKSTFLANMSHEIRTPMNGVIGLVDVLSQSGLQASQAEMVHLIRDSAELLLNIIDDILDFSKIEAGKLQIESAPMPLADVVERVCGLLDSMAMRRNVGLTVFVDPEIPETVVGDEFRLRQILINLIGNAIKFSGESDRPGRVALRVQCVGRRAGALMLELIVSDNGIGMDQNTLSRLFVPFSQADESTTRRYGGTGLGLAITQTLVRLLGGEISVRSAPLQGAEFTVRLPFGVAADAKSAASPDVLVEGLQCLIVGADAQLADDLSKYLSHAGAMVERSPDLEAAARLRHGPGVWLWLVLPDEDWSVLHRAGDEAVDISEGRPRYVIFGRGRRRDPRIDDTGLVTIDLYALTRQGLFRTLALAAGRIHAVEPRAITGPIPAAETVRSNAVASAWRGPILIAEDNATNREVIRRQLQLLGFAAEMATDGQQALQRWRGGEFPLLLTDLRMPVMDGYALAAAIRAEEPPGQRTSILALTANALPEEEQRCRAAGMDDYLVKPVKLARLRSAIEKWTPPSVIPQEPDAAQARSAAPAPPVDLNVLTELVGDDPADVKAVLKTFRTTADRISKKLIRSIADGLASAVPDPAHTLKSAAHSIGAARVAKLCTEIEEAAESGRAEQLAPLSAQLQTQLEAVLLYLDSLGH